MDDDNNNDGQQRTTIISLQLFIVSILHSGDYLVTTTCSYIVIAYEILNTKVGVMSKISQENSQGVCFWLAYDRKGVAEDHLCLPLSLR